MKNGKYYVLVELSALNKDTGLVADWSDEVALFSDRGIEKQVRGYVYNTYKDRTVYDRVRIKKIHVPEFRA